MANSSTVELSIAHSSTAHSPTAEDYIVTLFVSRYDGTKSPFFNLKLSDVETFFSKLKKNITLPALIAFLLNIYLRVTASKNIIDHLTLTLYLQRL